MRPAFPVIQVDDYWLMVVSATQAGLINDLGSMVRKRAYQRFEYRSSAERAAEWLAEQVYDHPVPEYKRWWE